MPFIGRRDELAFLEDCYASRKAQFVILYGRRRVGKTELLREFVAGKEHVFCSAKEAPSEAQLLSFSREMFSAGAPAGRYLSGYQSWEQAFEDIANLPFQGKKLVIIDEFPYIARSNPAVPSVIQNTWDALLSRQDVMVILCGSSMSFIEKEVLSEKSPLYGRTTGILKLLPLPYKDAAEFFPNWSLEDKATAHCILGGIPHYLLQFDPDESLTNNICRHILRRGASLYSEVEFLMRQEFRETSTYNAVVQAVALGATQLNDIAQKTMLPAKGLSTYIKNLIEVGLLEREFPAGIGLQEQGKPQRGLYRVCDNFFRFWYAYVYGNHSALEIGDVAGVWQHDIEPTLNSFCATPYEDMCRAWTLRANAAGALPIRCSCVGRWWDASDEIDVLGLDKGSRHALAGECKFKNSKVDERVLAKLQGKCTKLKADVVQWHLFSRGGFTEGLIERAGSDGSVRLIGLEELYA